MEQPDEFNFAGAIQLMIDDAEADERYDREFALLCGCKCRRADDCSCYSKLPIEEQILIFERLDLNFDQKMTELTMLRAAEKRKSGFRKLVTRADAIRARGLGISLA